MYYIFYNKILLHIFIHFFAVQCLLPKIENIETTMAQDYIPKSPSRFRHIAFMFKKIAYLIKQQWLQTSFGKYAAIPCSHVCIRIYLTTRVNSAFASGVLGTVT